MNWIRIRWLIIKANLLQTWYVLSRLEGWRVETINYRPMGENLHRIVYVGLIHRPPAYESITKRGDRLTIRPKPERVVIYQDPQLETDKTMQELVEQILKFSKGK